MNKHILKGWMLAVAGLGLLAGCDKDKNDPEPDPVKEYKYVVQTSSNLSNAQRPGNIRVFDTFPSGNISTIDQSFQGLGMAGWRPYGNWLLKMFDSKGYEQGIERLKIGAGDIVEVESFLKANPSTFGSGNFVIADETTGFYWDADAPLKIQKFNPTTLSRVSSGEIDLTAAVNERGTDEADIKFRSVGQKFLAVKNGKLFANITYAKTDGSQKGFWDDFYPDVYIAVIDIATGKYEKTTQIEGTGSIAYINDNPMYSFDTNGDLYIVCQGGDRVNAQAGALGGRSKIARIKANETNVDASWSLNMDDIRDDGKSKFVSVFAKDGKLIVPINNTPLTGGPQGNINLTDIWEFHVVDVNTKALTKVSGIPAVTNPGGSYGAVEIDDKVYLRVSTADGSMNGYYELNGTAATRTFDVTEGGSIQGIYKIEVE